MFFSVVDFYGNTRYIILFKIYLNNIFKKSIELGSLKTIHSNFPLVADGYLLGQDSK